MSGWLSPCFTFIAMFLSFFSSSICPCDLSKTYLILIFMVLLVNSAFSDIISPSPLEPNIRQGHTFVQENLLSLDF